MTDRDLPAAPRSPWVAPMISELPRLVKLTLQTGGAGGAGLGSPAGGAITGTGASTGFGF